MSTPLLTDGPFTYAQALDAGVPRDELVELCEAGGLVRASKGLYVPARLADDVDVRAAAVGLVLPPGAAVARETAAWLLGVDVRPPHRWSEPPLLECLVPAGVTPPRRPDLRAFSSDLPSDDVVLVRGVPCTSPLRTIVDLARYRAEYVGLGAVDAFLHRGLTTKEDLLAAVEPLHGRRFAARARRVIDLSEPATESPGESWLRLRLVEAGLPRPQVQISLRDERGVEVYRLDNGYPEEKAGLEYDGIEFHLRTSAQAERDAARREDIRRRFGWRVVGFTVGDVLGRRPVVEEVAFEMLGTSRSFRRRVWA